MSTESVFGGTVGTPPDLTTETGQAIAVTQNLSPETQNLLGTVFAGDSNASLNVETLTGGGSIISSTDSVGGGSQAVLIPAEGSVQAVTANVDVGEVKLNVALPPALSAVFEGVPPADNLVDLKAALDNKVSSYLAATPEVGTPEQIVAIKAANQEKTAALEVIKASIAKIVESLGDNGATPGTKYTITFVALSSTGGGTSGGGMESRATVDGDVIFDAGTAASSSEVLAFVMSNLKATQTLVMKNVEAALLLGNGTARVDGTKGALVSAGLGEQNLTGGMGNDTLIGGGGRDTLTGGLGSDVFGIGTKDAHIKVTDFTPGVDMLGFRIDGVTNLTDLSKLYTGFTYTAGAGTAAGDTVLNFGNDMSVTLVGVTPSQLTLDMLQFTL
jgi:Ca2+-binding RTX toxin-like protein